MRKSVMVLVIVLLCMCFVVNDSFTEDESVWEIECKVLSMVYKEPGVMKESGTLAGWLGSYAFYDYAAGLLAKIEGEEVRGEIKYEGGLQDGTPYSCSGIVDVMREHRFLVGGFVCPLKKAKINKSCAYGGLGFRYLYDYFGSDPYGYDRKSYYRYLPLGIEININLEGGAIVKIGVEYDYFLEGRQTSYMRPRIRKRQDAGYGYRGSIGIGSESLMVELFSRYWNIEASKVVEGWVEPKNNNTIVGISLSLRF